MNTPTHCEHRLWMSWTLLIAV